MYVILATVTLKHEHTDDFIKAVKINAECSKQTEQGCLRFDVLQDHVEKNIFYFYEIYVNEDAFKIHQQSPHFQHLSKISKNWFMGEALVKTPIFLFNE